MSVRDRDGGAGSSRHVYVQKHELCEEWGEHLHWQENQRKKERFVCRQMQVEVAGDLNNLSE